MSLRKKIKERSVKPRQFDFRAGSGGILRHLDLPDLRKIVNIHWDRVFAIKTWM